MAAPSHSIRTDFQKNILYVTLSGFMQPEQVRTAAEAVKREARRLKPGFSVINDIQQFQPASQDAVAYIADAQRFIHGLGPKRIIRVTGGATVSGLQLKRTARQAGYTADTAATVAEAERLALAP
ncbi:MAG: hypothetical protein R3362_01705 [Rhodothermales bacterium]|nr:hypothetical protein [Rhodothermales bacterium]